MKKVIVFIVTCFLASHSFAQYKLTDAFPMLPAFQMPVDLVSSPDGSDRLFVLEKHGKIYVFQNSPTISAAKIFLDLSSIVSQDSISAETGLLGLDFDPNFMNNGYFYVNYTTKATPLTSHVARFHVNQTDPDAADITSEKTILTLQQPFANHNGGCVKFGPGGYLFLSFGDGGFFDDPSNNGQSDTVLFGKILRINVNDTVGGKSYGIPADNPFASDATGKKKKEIYAYGLRNVWRFSFDSQTGKLWGADVGQGKWEEIDIIEKGKNYGWNIMEGSHIYIPMGRDTAGLVLPVWEYEHLSGNNSITGGYVYRGPSLPGLFNKYIYADYGTGRIWSLAVDNQGNVTNKLIIDKPNLSGGANASISSFGVDRLENLYAVGYSRYNGRIYKITDPTGAVKPEPNSDELVLIYPNPAKTEFVVELKGRSYTNYSLILTDLKGNVLLQKNKLTEATYKIDTKSYSAGSYFLRIEVGTKTYLKKVIIE